MESPLLRIVLITVQKSATGRTHWHKTQPLLLFMRTCVRPRHTIHTNSFNNNCSHIEKLKQSKGLKRSHFCILVCTPVSVEKFKPDSWELFIVEKWKYQFCWFLTIKSASYAPFTFSLKARDGSRITPVDRLQDATCEVGNVIKMWLSEWIFFLVMTINTWKCQWRIQDFPEVGAPTFRRGGGHHHTIFARFVQKNWMKLKEFGPRGKKRVQNFTM